MRSVCSKPSSYAARLSARSAVIRRCLICSVLASCSCVISWHSYQAVAASSVNARVLGQILTTEQSLSERLDTLHKDWSGLLADFVARTRRRESTPQAEDSAKPPAGAGCGRVTFERRVRARKRNDRGAILPALTDKVGGKEFARTVGVPAATTYFEARAPVPIFPLKDSKKPFMSNLDHLAAATTVSRARSACESIPELASLPQNFAFKATHTSGCNILVLRGVVAAHRPCHVAPAIIHMSDSWEGWENSPDLMRWAKALLGWENSPVKEESLVGLALNSPENLPPDVDPRMVLVEKCTNWLAQRYVNEDEWAYQQLKPGLVIEEVLWNDGARAEALMATPDADLLPELAEDLKCFAFDGRVPFLQHVQRRFSGASQKHDTFYADIGSGAWLRTNATMAGATPAPSTEALRPDILTRAQKLCARLSQGLPFVRVDLYLHKAPAHLEIDMNSSMQQAEFHFQELTLYPTFHKFRGKPDLNHELGKWWCDE